MPFAGVTASPEGGRLIAQAVSRREGGTGSASVDSFTWDLSTDEDKKAPATKK